MKINVNCSLTGRRTRYVITSLKRDLNDAGAESRDGVQN
jgi:hypothetical protein